MSGEGEECALKNCPFRGEVEDWFRALEDSMKNSLRAQMRNALIRYELDDLARTDWL